MCLFGTPDGHSASDIIVKWYNVTQALTVAPDVELPEFELTQSDVTDCTLFYTTGNQTGQCHYASVVVCVAIAKSPGENRSGTNNNIVRLTNALRM